MFFLDEDFAPSRISEEPEPVEEEDEIADHPDEPASPPSPGLSPASGSGPEPTTTETEPNETADSGPTTPTDPAVAKRGDPQDVRKTFVTPSELFGLPTCKNGSRKKKGGLMKKKTVIATDTPIRNALKEAEDLKRAKSSNKAQKRTKATRRLFKAQSPSDLESDSDDGVQTAPKKRSIILESNSDDDGTESDSGEQRRPQLTPESFAKLPRNPLKGDFVIVRFPVPSGSRKDEKRDKGTYVFYVAEVVQEMDDDGDVEVRYLRVSRKVQDAFVYPQVPDVASVPRKDIKSILPKCSVSNATSRLQSFLKFDVDFSKLRMG